MSWLLYAFVSGLAASATAILAKIGIKGVPSNLDKLSLAFAILLAAFVLGESISWRVALGAALMVAGALLTLGGCGPRDTASAAPGNRAPVRA